MNDTRVLRGSFPLAGWLVAAGWIAVAVFSVVRLVEPWHWIVMVVSLLAAAATVWVSLGLRVRIVDEGIVAAGIPLVPWERIDHIGVRTGVVNIPFLVVRRGRALDEVPLDGIASLRRGTALRLAQELADLGDLGEITVVEPADHPVRGRRGIE